MPDPRPEPRSRASRVTPVVSILAAVAGSAAIAWGWHSNCALAFHAGLGALVAGLLAGVQAARRSARAVRLAAPCLALASVLFALELAELALLLREEISPPVVGEAFYSYDTARADRAGFLRWWDRHRRRWADLRSDLWMPDPSGRNPYVLVPGATVTRGESVLHVNALGFRGREISREKGERFRIVALGESTTFGLTVLATDRTWPVVLEDVIARNLACDRPVEVINGGVGGWTIHHQTARLRRDVLALEPDLIVTYFGVNGFHRLLTSVPGLALMDYSSLRPRPSRVLEPLERELRVRPVRARQPDVSGEGIRAADARLRRTRYARLYRRLVRLSRAQGSEIALATFNLAVDGGTPEEVIRFYEERTPDVRSQILANQVHSRIVRLVAREEGAHVLDTSAQLDGSYRDAYVDLVHFNQVGRDRLASNVLAGIRPLLRSHPRLHCRARDRRS